MSNEELIAFLKKNVIAVACVAVCLAVAAGLYFRNDLLPEAEKTFSENAEKAALLAANIENMEQLKDQRAAIGSANQAMQDRMIRVGQLAENLQYFYKLESDTNAKLTDLRQNPLPPAGRNAAKTNFIAIGFSLTAQGSYAQLMDLLRRIEGGEHYCRILTCNVHPTSEGRGGALTMVLSLELLGTP